MRLSPEFSRNLWLELTLHRLIGMPAVLAAIFLLTYLVADQSVRLVGLVALILFYLLTLLWGTRQAGDSIIREISDHTWDSQRMTAISPWAMSWGKLLGSTIFPWYGGLICLLVYAALGGWGEESVPVQVVTGLLAALLATSVALLASLVALQKDRNLSSALSSSFMVLGVLAAGPVLMVIGYGSSESLRWYGQQWQAGSFVIGSLLFFCGWALLAIHRLMRHELQFRNGPGAWLVFLVLLPFYVAGFMERGVDPLSTRLLAGFVTVLLLAYGMVFVEEKNPIALKRAWWAVREGRWQQGLDSVPNWLVTLPLVLLYGLFLTLQQGVALQPGGSFGPGLVPLAAALFLLRDALLFLFFHLARNRKRADLATIFYLAVLYLLLPGMLSGFDLAGLLPLLLPFADNAGLLTLLAAAIQAGFVAALVTRRFRRLAVVPASRPAAAIDG